MTNVGIIILLIVCIGMGYILEPRILGLRHSRKAESSEVDKSTKSEQKPEPKAAPAPSIELDLSLVKPEDFPDKVALKETLHITEPKSGLAMELKQGTEVKPLRIEGSDLVYETIGIPLESRIHVDKTNFKELTRPRMLARQQKEAEMKLAAEAPAPEPVVLDEAAIIALLKSELDAGKVTKFKADQVINWEAGEEIEFDGQTYQSGFVIYQEENLLGTQDYKAIALISNGAVVKWINAKTELEIR